MAGAADVISAVFRNTILQLTVPHELRGRLSAVHIAVVTGGLGCVIGVALVAWRYPAFRRYTGPPEIADVPIESEP